MPALGEEPVVEPDASSPSDALEPAAEIPATEEPSLFNGPDTFSDPATEAVPDAPSPFDPQPTPDALIDPTPEEPAGSDPFDELDDPAPTAETPTPAESSLTDDIFGESEAPPAPTEEGSLFDGLDGLDGLTEGLPGTDGTPAAEPAADGDLFDGLLNPTSTQEQEEDSSESLFDELFGAIDLGSSLYLTAVERIECEQAEANHLTNVSSAVAAPKANVLDSTENRLWIDNTGEFSTDGRVIEITASHIRLLKENGRTCTVPLDRLSPSDASYVAELQEAISPESLIVMAR
jgi:hypothetical protein